MNYSNCYILNHKIQSNIDCSNRCKQCIGTFKFCGLNFIKMVVGEGNFNFMTTSVEPEIKNRTSEPSF